MLKSLRVEGDDLLQTLVVEIISSLQGNGNGQKAYLSVQLWEHPALKN